MGTQRCGRIVGAFGAALAIPIAYSVSRLGLEIARTSAGVAFDTCSPVDAIGALSCVGYAAYVAGLQGRMVYRNSRRVRALEPHITFLIVVIILAHFTDVPAGHQAAMEFFGAGAAWVGKAWVLMVGVTSGWAMGSNLGSARAWVVSLLALFALFVAFWAFVYHADRYLVSCYG